MTALNIIVIANYPLEKHYILASLVKGEVLLPEKIRATTGGIVTLTLAPHQPFQNRTITLTFRRGGARPSRNIVVLIINNLQGI